MSLVFSIVLVCSTHCHAYHLPVCDQCLSAVTGSFICAVLSSVLVPARQTHSHLYSSSTRSCIVGYSLVAQSPVMTSPWPVTLEELSPASCHPVCSTVLSAVAGLCIACNTIVLRKSAHGQCTLHTHRTRGWELFRVLPHSTPKVHPSSFM